MDRCGGHHSDPQSDYSGHRRDELADMFIAIADGSADKQDLLAWIRAHIRRNE